MHRRIAVVALALLLTGAGQVPAWAHADLTDSTPADGSVVPEAPRALALRFSERVEPTTMALLSRVATVPTAVRSSGAKVRVQPQRGLPTGKYALTWVVDSADGHEVNGSVAFAVGSAPSARGSQTLSMSPSVRTVLSTQRAGSADIRFPGRAVTGNVEWTHSRLKGPLSWPVADSSARGILPFSGEWKLRATLIDNAGAVVAVTGSTVLR